MKYLNGWKTYIGGAGLILVGVGEILQGEYALGFQHLSLGMVTVGARSFGQKILDTLQAVK